MKKKKSLLLMLLCCVMVFTCISLTGCGGTANDTDTIVYGSQDYT